jgi:hypothetical protein
MGRGRRDAFVGGAWAGRLAAAAVLVAAAASGAATVPASAMEVGAQDERMVTAGNAVTVELTLDRAQQLGAGWIRVMVSQGNVNAVGPVIQRARRRGLRVQGTLQWTGSEASFLSLASYAARRYRGAVQRWGVVNEPTWTMKGVTECGSRTVHTYQRVRKVTRWVWRRVRGGYIKRKLRRPRVSRPRATVVSRRVRAKRTVFVRTRKRYKRRYRLYRKRRRAVRVAVTREKLVPRIELGCRALAPYDRYRRLFRQAYPLIKRESGGAEVLIGETNSGAGARPWIEHLLCMRPAVGDCSTITADGFAHHPYQFAEPPEQQTGRWGIGDTPAIQATLREAAHRGVLRNPQGGTVPLLYNEFGLVGKSNVHAAQPDAVQASWLPRAYEYARRHGVKHVTQYHLMPSHYDRWDSSILDDLWQPRPQFHALAHWVRTHR